MLMRNAKLNGMAMPNIAHFPTKRASKPPASFASMAMGVIILFFFLVEIVVSINVGLEASMDVLLFGVVHMLMGNRSSISTEIAPSAIASLAYVTV